MLYFKFIDALQTKVGLAYAAVFAAHIAAPYYLLVINRGVPVVLFSASTGIYCHIYWPVRYWYFDAVDQGQYRLVAVLV